MARGGNPNGNPQWKPGTSGNPTGGFREKKFLAALERAVAQDDGKRLREAAEQLLNIAASGEAWAIQQLADRLDGKPTQQMDMRVARPLEELSDAELAAIASGASGAGTADAPPGAKEPSSLH